MTARRKSTLMGLFGVGAFMPLSAAEQVQAEAAASAAASVSEASQWGFAVFVCVALLVALLVMPVILKRYGRQWRLKGFSERRVQILEKTSLGPGSALVVVTYRGRQLLLATGGAHTRCLRDDPLGTFEDDTLAVSSASGPKQP